MTRIDSVHNEQIKMLRSLHTKKGRQRHRGFLVEGEKMVAEALRDCPRRIRRIYQADSFPVPFQTDISTWNVADSLMERISSHTTPQGILAVVDRADADWEPGDGVLVLDGVQDPGNVGTLIRAAEAFGFAVLLLPTCTDPYGPKSVQASMGSILRVPVTEGSLSDLLKLKRTHRLLGAALGGKIPAEVSFSKPLALVLGSESHGLSKDVTAHLHETVELPMKGKTESLNVGIAGGILMYLSGTAE